jgi:hypothetical protein
MKTSELSGAMLDYWTARAEGTPANRVCFTRMAPDAASVCTKIVEGGYGGELAQFYRPSTDWAECGPLIGKWAVSLRDPYEALREEQWEAHITTRDEDCAYSNFGHAPTPQQAICRAVVKSVFGDEVPEGRA